MHPYDIMLDLVHSFFLVNVTQPLKFPHLCPMHRYLANEKILCHQINGSVDSGGFFLLWSFLEGDFFTNSIFDSRDNFDMEFLTKFNNNFQQLISAGFFYPASFSNN